VEGNLFKTGGTVNVRRFVGWLRSLVLVRIETVNIFIGGKGDSAAREIGVSGIRQIKPPLGNPAARPRLTVNLAPMPSAVTQPSGGGAHIRGSWSQAIKLIEKRGR
jgi:hypothetical protein